MSPLVGGNSYWIESTPTTHYPALDSTVDVDVCVVGGGITGLLTAWELADAGLSVAVLERGRIAASVTGYTTAKLTSQHGLRYARLSAEHCADAARTYGQINESAVRRIRTIASELGISGDIERRNSYVFATRSEGESELREEARAAISAGLPASYVTEVPLPFATVGAVKFTDQAQLHPRRLLLPLAAGLTQRGVQIFEQSPSRAVEFDDRWRVTCGDGEVRATQVVMATLLPAAGIAAQLRGHLYCHQGYAVAMPLLGEAAGPDGVFISHERPMRSLRTIASDGGRLLQVGGAAHVHDPASGDTPFDDLESWARERFAVGETSHRWTTQDYSSSDGMPLIGDVDGVLVATGFGGWGISTASVAANLFRAHLTGDAMPDTDAAARLFDPGRALPVASRELISAHTSSGSDRDARTAFESLPRGSAVVVSLDGDQVGAFRDPQDELHVVSAVCTHQGGIMLWDSSDTTWTCPCHGSKFTPDGRVVAGPAREPLTRLE